MPHVYRNNICNFSGFSHFVETGVKTLNELFGRDQPFDEFDSAKHPDGRCILVGWRDGEKNTITEKEVGDVLNDEDLANFQRVEDEALADNKIIDHSAAGTVAAADDTYLLGSDVQPSTFKLADGSELSLGEIVRRAFVASGLITPKDWNVFATEKPDEQEALIQAEVDKLDLYDADEDDTTDDGINATDAATAFAADNNIDLKLVTGTGKEGRIGKADVQAYLTANPAPEQENANDEQGNNLGTDDTGPQSGAGPDPVS